MCRHEGAHRFRGHNGLASNSFESCCVEMDFPEWNMPENMSGDGALLEDEKRCQASGLLQWVWCTPSVLR
jgi:hypothetical protein